MYPEQRLIFATALKYIFVILTILYLIHTYYSIRLVYGVAELANIPEFTITDILYSPASEISTLLIVSSLLAFW